MNEAFLVRTNTLRSIDTAKPTQVSTAIYLNEIPPFVESELQQLYAHLHSSLPFMQIFQSMDQVSTYVARHGAKTTAILLFRLGSRRIEVLNQSMQMERTELRRFAACVFDQFPSIGVICFKGIHTDLVNFPYPVQRGHAMEDIVITLPATVADYTASLGKSTRSNLKYYKGKLEKSFSSVSFQVYEKDKIDEQLIYDLIKLSEIRISAKKVNFRINGDCAKRIVELARLCGIVNVISVDGQICAGAISYRLGASQFTEVIAHDDKFKNYSPGMLCFYQAICDSIGKGVKRYHLGGGKLNYKVWLLGVQQDMEQLEIYRPCWGMVLNCDWVVKTWIKARILRLKTWLRRHETSLPVRLLLQGREAMRKITKGRGIHYAICVGEIDALAVPLAKLVTGS